MAFCPTSSPYMERPLPVKVWKWVPTTFMGKPDKKVGCTQGLQCRPERNSSIPSLTKLLFYEIFHFRQGWIWLEVVFRSKNSMWQELLNHLFLIGKYYLHPSKFKFTFISQAEKFNWKKFKHLIDKTPPKSRRLAQLKFAFKATEVDVIFVKFLCWFWVFLNTQYHTWAELPIGNPFFPQSSSALFSRLFFSRFPPSLPLFMRLLRRLLKYQPGLQTKAKGVRDDDDDDDDDDDEVEEEEEEEDEIQWI